MKNGLFPSESSYIFSKLMKYSEEAGHNPSYFFIKEDFHKLKDEI